MRTLTALLATLVVFSASQLFAAGPTIGSQAPAFSLSDQNGKTVSLSDFTGKIVVLEWFNEGCPIVQRHYHGGDGDIPQTVTKYMNPNVVWLAINSTSGNTNDSNKTAAAKWSMNRQILNDSSGKVGHEYGATNTPQMFIIGKDGKLLYDGAIDDDPEGDKATKVNYVSKALDEILAGKDVSVPQSKAYGCKVHYAN